MTEKKTDIDFVIPWVNSADREWQKEKDAYAGSAHEDMRKERFRDWENLKYWFRGVERYAPWVQKIHFITCGHLPDWMNTGHPKLHIVKHSDYIPQEFLPTFSSHTIELNLHRIEGLSEHFVYFNDDIFLTNSVKPQDFFQNGKPCDMLAFQPVVANPSDPVMSHIYLNNTLVLSKYFKKRENVRKQPGNYFKPGYPPLYFCYNLLELAFPLYSGLYTVHGAASYCKQTFFEVWEKEEARLRSTCGHKFRSEEDVNQYLFREWQKLSGAFYAKNITWKYAYFNIGNKNDRLIRVLEKQSKKMVCINDSSEELDFEKTKQEINRALFHILPEKSSFER